MNTPTEPPAGAFGDTAAEQGGLELFDPAASRARWKGRAGVRRRVMAMRPVRDTGLAMPAGSPSEPFWAITGADDLTLLMRTEGYTSPAQAAADAEELRKSTDLRGVIVADAAGLPDRRRSLWIVCDGKVVLVAALSWRLSGTSAKRYALRRIQAVLPALALPGTPGATHGATPVEEEHDA